MALIMLGNHWVDGHLRPEADLQGIRALVTLDYQVSVSPPSTTVGVTDEIFQILRNAGLDDIKMAVYRNHEEWSLVVDPQAVGWPGWRRIIEIAAARRFNKAAGLDDKAGLNATPECRCGFYAATLKKARETVQTMIRESKRQDDQAKMDSTTRRSIGLVKRLQQAARALSESPIATPEEAEDLMMESDAGRLLTIETAENILVILTDSQKAIAELSAHVTVRPKSITTQALTELSASLEA